MKGVMHVGVMDDEEAPAPADDIIILCIIIMIFIYHRKNVIANLIQHQNRDMTLLKLHNHNTLTGIRG